ncbi:MAG: OmpH family outer membrane protein [Desulfobacteraceae bacterium]|jgi:outer membrane protein
MRIYKLCFISVIIFLVSSPFVYSADVAKIGIIDFQRIIEESNPGSKANDKINAEGKKMEAELTKKASEIEEMKKQLEREALVMSSEKREQNERDFRIRVNDFKGLQKKYEQDLQRLQKKIVNQLKEDVLKIAEEIGKKEGFQLILEKTRVLYVPESLDITERIIKEYNKKGLELNTEQKKN